MTEKTPYHHGHLRQALINEGLRILESKGLDSLSLRALAETLGVSKTAPYRHFPTKRDLLIALAAEGYQIFADKLEEWEKILINLNKEDHLQKIYAYYGEFALERPELYRLMFSRLGNSLHSERCKLNAERAFSVLVTLAQSLTEKESDPRSMTLSLFANLHGWAMLLMDDLIPPTTGVNQDNWLDFALKPDSGK